MGRGEKQAEITVAVFFGGGEKGRVCSGNFIWWIEKREGFAARWDHSGSLRKGRLEEGELSITVVVHLVGERERQANYDHNGCLSAGK